MWYPFGIVVFFLMLVSRVTSDRDFCSRFDLIPRCNWSWVKPTCQTPMTVPVDYFFVHVTDHHECSTVAKCSEYVRNLQNGHMNDNHTKWCDIGYNFLVGGDGSVYEGTGWNYEGTHTRGYNPKSFAVSFMGKFKDHAPSEKMLKAAQNLIACGVQTGRIKCDYQLKGHRDVSTKKCPNDVIYGLIQKWPRFFKYINDAITAISLDKDPTNIVEVKESFCDFQNDFCEWRQGIGSQFDWVRHKGLSDCAGKTGPTGDRHGNVTGFYIVADASKNERKRTKLRSPNIPVESGYHPFCLTFYYLMFGKDMGTLRLHMFHHGITMDSSEIIWETNGPQEDRWMEQKVVTKQFVSGGTIHFEFTAIMGDNYLSDIALDDIIIKPGTC